jgi:deoxyribose-phosphate aldolase
MMSLSKVQIARMIDISAVKSDSTAEEVESVVNAAKEHRFICVFTLPSFASYAKKLLSAETDIDLGGTVGFPSGSSTTSSKVFEAAELVNFGCSELDMVINIGKLKSHLYQEVAADIKEIVEVAGIIPVKVILEVNVLTDSEIQDGAKIIRDNGAKFVKTGTGWLGTTSFEHIRLIKESVGESIQLKVAGGVRDLHVLLQMHDMGVSRFGIGNNAAIKIMNEFTRNNKG